MISDRGQDERIVSVVSRVMKLNPGERETYVRLACAGDTHLYHEITEAVSGEQRMGDFLRQPLFRLQESARPFAPGQLVSERFEIIREIGEGGMGVVYEAFDRKRNQPIAIKTAKPGFHQMLSPEVEGALRVRHPNVCLVNEIHTARTKDGEVDFITMELLRGTTLASRLSSSGTLPVDEALEIARQLCNGLKAAHASGIVHGDLKADNIFLCREANGKIRAVITDFGLSGGCSESEAVGGTPRYMAPELWLGAKSSQASDIYALGVIFHEMVAGHFTPSIDAAKPKLDKSEVPRFYSRIVEGCLSIDASRRCSAFSDALQSLAEQKNPWTRRKLLIAGVASACAAGTSLWWNRDTVENGLHPLPHKRFVALLPWPASFDSQSKPLLAGIIDAIENELARAEVSDRDLYVISTHQADIASLGPAELRKLCQSVGANLLLGAFLSGDERQFQLRLTVQNALNDTVLRHRQLVSNYAELTGLIPKAVQAAAALLNVRLEQNLADRLAPPTDSVAALSTFQKAEELKNQTNDAGLESAIDTYKKAIDADPRYVNAYAKLAIAYSRFHSLHHDSGALELAQRNAEKAISLDEKSADAHLALATVFAARGNESQALSEIDEATKADPTNPRTVLWKGQIYTRFHRWTEAEQAFEELKRERPNYWLGYHELGVLLNSQGRYQEALQAFQAAAAAAPGSALALSNLGALQFKLGNSAQAEISFRKSVALQPNDVGYSNLADVLRAQGKYADAVQFGEQAVKLNPSEDQNWLGLGDSQALRGKAQQAHDAYIRAASEVKEQLKTDPTDGSSWVRLALYQLKSGSAEDAISLLNKADTLGANDVDTDLAKARVLELLHRRKEALLLLASCFGRGTTAAEVSCIRDLDNLRKDPQYAQLLKKSAAPGKS